MTHISCVATCINSTLKTDRIYFVDRLLPYEFELEVVAAGIAVAVVCCLLPSFNECNLTFSVVRNQPWERESKSSHSFILSWSITAEKLSKNENVCQNTLNTYTSIITECELACTSTAVIICTTYRKLPDDCEDVPQMDENKFRFSFLVHAL